MEVKSFIIVAALLSSLITKGQVSTLLGVELTGAYLTNKTRLAKTGFSDQLGFGAQVNLRIGLGREERMSMKIGAGYLYRSINGELLSFTSTGNDEIQLHITRQYLSNELLFGYHAIAERDSRLIISIGGSSLLLLDEQQDNSRGIVLVTSTTTEPDIAIGGKASIAYERSLGRSGLALRTSAGYTHFFDDVEYAYMLQLTIGVLWELQGGNDRGLF